MGLDSYAPLKKSGQSVIHRNLPYRFLRGQPLKGGGDSWHFRLIATCNGYFNLTDIGLLIIILEVAVIDLCF